jgi:hypothetical protein
MIPCSSSSPALDARIARILKALNEVNRCVNERGKAKAPAWGLTIGELDWLGELHDSIYET